MTHRGEVHNFEEVYSARIITLVVTSFLLRLSIATNIEMDIFDLLLNYDIHVLMHSSSSQTLPLRGRILGKLAVYHYNEIVVT